MVLTVMSRVSGQFSMVPTGFRVQSNARMRRAISPVPKMKFCGRLRGAGRARILSWALTVTFWAFTVTNGSCGRGDFRLRRSFALLLCTGAQSLTRMMFFSYGMGDGMERVPGRLTNCFGWLRVKGSGSGILCECESPCFILVC